MIRLELFKNKTAIFYKSLFFSTKKWKLCNGVVSTRKSKVSAFQNIQKIWKRLSIENITKDLVSDFRIQKSHVTFTMHVPCIPYMGTDVWYTG